MGEALAEARRALLLGEVPIGAVVVRGNRIIGRGHNEVETRRLATAHAELIALERASKTLGDWRLDGCAVYVTVEPCHMCLGAFYLSRIERLVYGARQPRSGACGSAGDLHEAGLLGHEIEVRGGVMEDEAVELLQRFFAGLRKQQ